MIVNGQKENAAGQSIAELLRAKKIDKASVAVERNGEIVPKSQYETVILTDADRLEIVSFVGGG